jgi:hypothetical protein
LRSVGAEKLKESVRRAIKPFEADDGSIRMEVRFRYVVAAT